MAIPTHIFGIQLEFSPQRFLNVVDSAIGCRKAGYVCVVDSSVLARTQRESAYRDVINNALINTCDGSSIALLAKILYGGSPQVFNGPQIFEHYVETTKKQVVLGNTTEIVEQVKQVLIKKGKWNHQLTHIDLPFTTVDNFDYEGIAKSINELNPDIIWVSLGNPKQEIFMSKIIPYIKEGIMFGIGAALNFYTGDLKLPSFHIGPLKFIWLTRLFQDPRRQIKANWYIIKVLPKMIWNEWKIKRNTKFIYNSP